MRVHSRNIWRRQVRVGWKVGRRARMVIRYKSSLSRCSRLKGWDKWPQCRNYPLTRRVAVLQWKRSLIIHLNNLYLQHYQRQSIINLNWMNHQSLWRERLMNLTYMWINHKYYPISNHWFWVRILSNQPLGLIQSLKRKRCDHRRKCRNPWQWNGSICVIHINQSNPWSRSTVIPQLIERNQEIEDINPLKYRGLSWPNQSKAMDQCSMWKADL